MNITIKEINKGEASTLVEWRNEKGHLHRAYVPTSVVSREEDLLSVDEETLEQAVPFGDNLESLFPEQVTFSASDFASALRDNGLWSFQDLLTSPKTVRGAFLAMDSAQYSNALNGAKRRLKEENG